jgi:hypothetical protein
MEITFPSTMVGDLRKIRGQEIAEVAEQVDGGGAADGGFSAILGGCWVSTIDRGPYPSHVFEAAPPKMPRRDRRAGAYRTPAEPTSTTGGPDWRRALKGDLVAGVIHLCRISITDGDDYEFDVPCRACGKPIEWELKLSDLPVRVLPPDSLKRLRAGEPFEATVAGRKVLFDLQTHAGEEPVAALMKQQQRKTATIVDALASQVRSVDGVGSDLRARWAWLADLSMGELQDLQEEMEDADCGVDTGIRVGCARCSYEQEVNVPLDRRLFSPRRRKRPRAGSAPAPTSSGDPSSPGAA